MSRALTESACEPTAGASCAAGQPGEAWALFLDFDGTLVEIAERPEAVTVDPALPDTLAQLRDRLGGALALISGRPIEVLDRFLSPHRFDAAGLHGVEHRIAGHLSPCRSEEHPALRRAVERLGSALVDRRGVLVEDKGCSVAVHWRLAPDQAEAAARTVQEVAAELGSGYRLQNGKAVAEILPASAGKGPVIERFLRHAPYSGRRPMFVGDDLTDENGFAAVQARGGAAVRVGPGPTLATYRLPSPQALRDRLSRWAADGRIEIEASSA